MGLDNFDSDNLLAIKKSVANLPTLRDQFAMAILTGLCANSSIIGYCSQVGWAPVNCTRKNITEYAFAMTDEAMEARKERKE